MDKFKYSLLHKSLRGVVIVYTGQPGAGKTLATLFDPNNTVFIDADHRKGKEMADRKPKMIYKPINSDDRKDLVKTGELFLEAIDSIDYNKTTVVVIDNIQEVQDGVHAYVLDNPVESAKMYNLVAKNIASRGYGHDTIAHERIVKGAVDELLANDITVVITAHMKPKYLVPGQLEPKGRAWIYEAASLYCIMIRTGEAPDALVFKNAYVYHIDVDPEDLTEGELEKYRRGELELSKIYQRVPRRIPGYTPAKLYRYLSRTPEEMTPYGPDEILTEDEMRPYLEILTKQQVANVDKIMEQEMAEAERYKQFEDNLKEVQRVELNRFIKNNPDMPVSELLAQAKLNFQMFAAELTPVYILEMRD